MARARISRALPSRTSRTTSREKASGVDVEIELFRRRQRRLLEALPARELAHLDHGQDRADAVPVLRDLDHGPQDARVDAARLGPVEDLRRALLQLEAQDLGPPDEEQPFLAVDRSWVP